VDQKANPEYPGFYNGRGSRRGAWPRGMGDVKSPSGVQGQSPGRCHGPSPPEAEAKCEISVQTFNIFL